VSTYLGRLVSDALRGEKRRIIGTRWLITDPARVADARQRLDAIALSPGQVDVAQAAEGGLAHAIDLDVFLYPGKANRSARERLQQIAEGQWTIEAVTGAAADAASSDPAAATTHRTIRAVVHASTSAVIQAVRDKRAAADAGGT
jgi:Golgi phosphoprotein 3 GPP34